MREKRDYIKCSIVFILIVLSLCGCSKSRNKDINENQVSAAPTRIDNDEKISVVPSNAIPTEKPTEAPTGILSNDNTVQSSNNMDKLIEISNSLKTSGIYEIDSVRDQEKFEEIWSLIYEKWYPIGVIEQIKEKNVLSKLDESNTLLLHPGSFQTDGEQKEYIIQCSDYGDAYGFSITSFGLTDEGDYRDIIGTPVYEGEEVSTRDPFTCYILDMKDSEIWEYSYSKIYGYAGTRISDYINQSVLVGNYMDERGKNYSFQQDKTANWDGKEFRYDIVIDAPKGATFNRINVVDEDGKWKNETYGYRVEDNQLLLFEVEQRGDTWTLKSKTPKAILKKNGLIYMKKTGKPLNNMEKLAALYNSLKDESTYVIDSIQNQDRFMEIWSLIYSEWVPEKLAQEIDDKISVTKTDNLESLTTDEPYVMQLGDNIHSTRFAITSFEINKQDHYLYLYGNELGDGNAVSSNESKLCFVLDIEHGVLRTNDQEDAFVFNGSNIRNDTREPSNSMEKIAAICNSLKKDGTFVIDPVQDQFEEICSLIYSEWYPKVWIQEAKEKKVFSPFNEYDTITTYFGDFTVDGRETNNFVLMELDAFDGCAQIITSIHLKADDDCLYFYGREIEDGGIVHFAKPELCFQLDTQNSELQENHSKCIYGYAGGDLSNYINETLLVGDYTDQNGKSYSFTKDKMADWNGKKFQYEITTVCLSGPECNILYVMKDGQRHGEVYGYCFEDDKLMIYNVEYHEEEEDFFLASETPIAILTKTSE